MTSINPKTLEQAREWARDNISGWHFTGRDRALAAAEVIQSLPDEVIDGERVRDALDHWEFSDISAGEFVDMVRDLLPTADQRKTLADMEVSEALDCEWLPAEVDDYSSHEFVITKVFEGGQVRVLEKTSGAAFETDHDKVIPILDAPKMRWPDTKM